MAKKQKEVSKPEAPKIASTSQYRIVNLTQKIFPVPYLNSKGEAKFLNLRLQKGRQGQDAPVLPATAISPALKALEKKGLIRIEKI